VSHRFPDLDPGFSPTPCTASPHLPILSFAIAIIFFVFCDGILSHLRVNLKSKEIQDLSPPPPRFFVSCPRLLKALFPCFGLPFSHSLTRMRFKPPPTCVISVIRPWLSLPFRPSLYIVISGILTPSALSIFPLFSIHSQAEVVLFFFFFVLCHAVSSLRSLVFRCRGTPFDDPTFLISYPSRRTSACVLPCFVLLISRSSPPPLEDPIGRTVFFFIFSAASKTPTAFPSERGLVRPPFSSVPRHFRRKYSFLFFVR